MRLLEDLTASGRREPWRAAHRTSLTRSCGATQFADAGNIDDHVSSRSGEKNATLHGSQRRDQMPSVSSRSGDFALEFRASVLKTNMMIRCPSMATASSALNANSSEVYAHRSQCECAILIQMPMSDITQLWRLEAFHPYSPVTGKICRAHAAGCIVRKL